VDDDSSILTTRQLGLDIGGATIVADVGLEVPAGEFLGIIGPNGAGKTTLFNLLSGLMRPTTGRIELKGRDVTEEPVHARTQAGLGRTFQISSVFPQLSVLENVRLAVEASRGGAMRIWRLASSNRDELERARWALARVGLDDRASLPAGSLPHGDKRKLELAMLLGADRQVLLLDEPMAGVSAGDVPGLVEVIRTVHEEEKKTVLMVEHHIGVVTGLAERIAVMHHGSLLAVDTPERVMDNAEVQEAYLGEPL
jgi:branched-chain amino acid transport system ATP-binding protein